MSNGQDSGQAGRPFKEHVNIGGFEIIEEIGRGGMGVVYKAMQRSVSRVVALKVLSSRLAGNRNYVRRFVREARAAARLNHPNIVQGTDVGKSGGYYYFAMEYVDGETAASKAEREGPLKEEEALKICLQMAQALHHAHAQANIIHRDVKPQNILLARDGTAKLADLGLAREAARDDSSVTLEGATLGTPNYISPEQIRGKCDLDGRCDVYSLGATLYHLLAGKPPYVGETTNVVMAKHLTEPIPDLSAERPDISRGTAAIVRKAMQKEREDRYESAAEMAEAIDAVLRGQVAQASRVPQGPHARLAGRAKLQRARGKSASHTALAVGIIIIAAAALVVFLTIWLGEQDAPLPERKPPPTIVQRPKPPDERPKPPTERPGASKLKHAHELVLQSKDKPWLIIAPLEGILQRCRGSECEAAVKAILDKAKDDFRKVAQAELERCKTRADELAAKNRYGDGLDALDEFPAHLRTDETKEALDSLARSVLERGRKAYEDRKQSAEVAAAAGDFAKAIETIQSTKTFDLPGLAEEVGELVEKWQAEKVGAERKAKAENFKLMILRMTKILAALRDRQYAEARRLAEEAAHETAQPDDAERFRLLNEDIKSMESLWTEAVRSLEAMKPGDSIRLNGIKRTFVSFKNGMLTVQGTAEPVPLISMRDADFLDLLQPYFAADKTQSMPLLKRAFFYTFDRCRDLNKALGDLDAAAKLGAAQEVERGRFYVSFVSSLEAEEAASALLGDARAAASKKQWSVLAEKLKELDKYQSTRAYGMSEAELAELAQLLEVYGEEFKPGLIGSYYDGTKFEKLKHTAIANTVNLRGEPLFKAAGRKENFSVRWEGYIKIEETGSYVLGLAVDDGFRLWLDDRQLLDEWKLSQKSTASTKPMPLQKGFHKIKIEFFQGPGDAYVEFWWYRGSKYLGVVPPSALFHSTGQGKKLGIRPRKAPSATFASTDERTRGNWKGVYGSDGYNIIGDTAKYPAYATVNATSANLYTWGPTNEKRAPLQTGAGRIASCWHNNGFFTIDINLTDGKTHRLSIYVLDWDTKERAEDIEVRDADTGDLLDSRTVSDFHDGKYLVWDISGHVKMRFTKKGGRNALLSGIFFDTKK